MIYDNSFSFFKKKRRNETEKKTQEISTQIKRCRRRKKKKKKVFFCLHLFFSFRVSENVKIEQEEEEIKREIER
jgi:hypothetical protein